MKTKDIESLLWDAAYSTIPSTDNPADVEHINSLSQYEFMKLIVEAVGKFVKLEISDHETSLYE